MNLQSKAENDARLRQRLHLLMLQSATNRPSTATATATASDFHRATTSSLATMDVNSPLQRLFDHADPVLSCPHPPQRNNGATTTGNSGALSSALAQALSATTTAPPTPQPVVTRRPTTTGAAANCELWDMSRQILENSRMIDSVLQAREADELAVVRAAQIAQATSTSGSSSSCPPTPATPRVLPHAASILGNLLQQRRAGGGGGAGAGPEPAPAVRGLFASSSSPSSTSNSTTPPSAAAQPPSDAFVGLLRGNTPSAAAQTPSDAFVGLLRGNTGASQLSEHALLASLQRAGGRSSAPHQTTLPCVPDLMMTTGTATAPAASAADNGTTATALMAALRGNVATSTSSASSRPRVVTEDLLVRALAAEQQQQQQQQQQSTRATLLGAAVSRVEPRNIPSTCLPTTATALSRLQEQRQLRTLQTLQALEEQHLQQQQHKTELPPIVGGGAATAIAATAPMRFECKPVLTANALATATGALTSNINQKSDTTDSAVFIPLAIEQDVNWLSECQCMLRSDFIEITQASRKEFNAEAGGGSSEYMQVGIRCRYCAHLPSGQRPSRSSAFPSSIKQLYQSFTMMQRDHFHKCKAIPLEKRQRLEALRKTNTQGACDSKQYWIYAAQTMGMFDTHRGIEITAESREAGKKMPLFGVKNDSAAATTTNTTGGGSEAAAPMETTSTTCSTTTGTKTHHAPLVMPTDASKVHPFLYLLLSQLEIVELLPTEQAGKRKSLPIGFCGVGCRYCCPRGRLGFSRTFPLRRRTLPTKLDDMFAHLLRCPLCPTEVKTQLATLVGTSGSDQQRKSVYQHPELLDRIWKQLGREGDVSF